MQKEMWSVKMKDLPASRRCLVFMWGASCGDNIKIQFLTNIKGMPGCLLMTVDVSNQL